MFTGIVNELGTITGLRQKGEVVRICIARGNGEDRIGDSICINGVCLTIISLADSILEFDISLETAKTTTLGNLRISDRVNMERALRLSDRLGGHLLSGHIDGIGHIRKIQKRGQHYLLGVEVPQGISCYLVPKGSIGIDGVSLTIATLREDLVWASVIPHTAEVTTLKEKRAGEKINVEADLLAKYIHRILTGHPQSAMSSPDAHPLERAFLAKHGFLS